MNRLSFVNLGYSNCRYGLHRVKGLNRGKQGRRFEPHSLFSHATESDAEHADAPSGS